MPGGVEHSTNEDRASRAQEVVSGRCRGPRPVAPRALAGQELGDRCTGGGIEEVGRAGVFHLPDNLDPIIPVELPTGTELAVTDLLNNGLLDPPVANAAFPFDRPMLRSELAAPPSVPAMPMMFGFGAKLGPWNPKGEAKVNPARPAAG